MAREVLFICDYCNHSSRRPSKEIESIAVPVGRSPDPAGGSSETDYKNLDLCVKCMAILLGKYLTPDYEYNRKTINNFLAGRKKNA